MRAGTGGHAKIVMHTKKSRITFSSLRSSAAYVFTRFMHKVDNLSIVHSHSFNWMPVRRYILLLFFLGNLDTIPL